MFKPGRLEEDVITGKMVIGVNAYREICTLHLAGQVVVYRALVTKLAAEKIVKKMKAAVPRDEGTWSSQKIKGPAGHEIRVGQVGPHRLLNLT